MALIVKSLPGVVHPPPVEKPRKIRVFATINPGLGHSQRHSRPTTATKVPLELLRKRLNVL